MRIPLHLSISGLLLATLLSTTAQAQTAGESPAAAAPAVSASAGASAGASIEAGTSAEASDTAVSATHEESQAQPADTCFPTCRDGYLCHEGQCISACNPPCAGSDHCVNGRYCAPVGHFFSPEPPHGFTPWPPLPPSDVDVPPPPGAWHPPVIQKRTPRRSHFYGYFGLQLGLGGAGKLELADDRRDFDSYGEESSFDLKSSVGVEAAMEFRISRYFGVGPGLRYFRARADNGIGRTNNVDVLVVPTLHLPFSNLEVFLPIPLGLTFGSAADKLSGDDTGGLTIGLNPGLLAWLTKTVGLYAQLGVQAHFRGYQRPHVDYVFRFHRPTLTLGISLRN